MKPKVGDWATAILAEPLNPLNSHTHTNLQSLRKPALHQNYPNPFNSIATIQFHLPMAQSVNIEIFNLLGKELANFQWDVLPAGPYPINWQPGSLPSGIYHYRLITRNQSWVRSCILLK